MPFFAAFCFVSSFSLPNDYVTSDAVSAAKISIVVQLVNEASVDFLNTFIHCPLLQ